MGRPAMTLSDSRDTSAYKKLIGPTWGVRRTLQEWWETARGRHWKWKVTADRVKKKKRRGVPPRGASLSRA